MYGGRAGYGSQLPTSLGERSNAVYDLSGVSPAGYGPYLGNFFDDLARIAGKVGIVSNELSKVASGQATVATIPTGQASLTIPIPGAPISTSIPLWVIGAGAAGLLLLALRKRR